MTKYLSFILPLFIGFAMTGCSDSDGVDSDGNFERIDIVLTQPEKDIALGQYDFPVKLLSTAYTTQGKKNTMVSPVSASMVLGMVANAIDSTGRGEILDVMNLKDNDELQTYNTYMQKLLNNLPNIDKRSTFAMSNAFHLADDGALSPNYNQILSNYYSAEIGRFKQFDISVVNNVNKWVNEKTKGGIPEILSENDVNDYSKKFLKTIWINALYFNGSWRREFNKSNTRKAPFYQNYPDESVFTTVDMMSGRGYMTMKYLNNSHYRKDAMTTAVIPYGNDSYLFTAILPPYNNPDISATLKELTPEYWSSLDNWYQSKMLSSMDAQVNLPKMQIGKENNVIPTFKNMGLKNLLDNLRGESMKANLGYDDPVYLNIFRQNAILDLNEKGTEVKVVTITGGVSISAIDPEVTFNRPFIYFIRERSTGAVLLAGVYTTE